MSGSLEAIAREFSPRYECDRDDLVSIDVSGLERLFLRRPVRDTPERNGARALASGGGAPRSVWKIIGEELRREAASRGIRVHVAVAGTRMAALVLALARPGLTIVEPGEHADALAPIPIGILEKIQDGPVSVLKRWGVNTLGELAALPPADLSARLGRPALLWQGIARGDDVRPLIPTLAEERFESSMELEWPIEGLEPLSFVLTRLLEPLSTRLERRDRGAAVLHVLLRLVTKDMHACRLELPTPMRDVRTLRTLALLDLESHPPAAAIDRVTIVIDPTPGRVLQHTLFTRAHPTPEQLSTLLARLGALMGQDRLGAPEVVDSYRPGAFRMAPFATCHDVERPPSLASDGPRELRRDKLETGSPASFGVASSHQPSHQPLAISHEPLTSALRRCRHPVPARVTVDDGRPVRVTTDRRGFVGGSVVTCAGPWRTSGEWWAGGAGKAGGVDGAGRAGGDSTLRRPVLDMREGNGPSASGVGVGPHALRKSWQGYWHRDEWDVAVSDGAVYRIFQDRDTDAWFIEAIVD